MTRPNGSGPDHTSELDTVRALARAVERGHRHMQRLDDKVNALAEAVNKLNAAPSTQPTDGEAQASSDPEGPGVRSWLLADDPAQAAADLDDLVRWVWRVYLWFPDTSLSSCWLWHPAVVEELWCLRVAHAEAFQPSTGSVLRVTDWHERLRPGVVARVMRDVRICELNRHISYNGHPVEVLPPGPPPLARHAGAVADVWAGGAGLEAVRAAGPTPTPEHLGEADAYQRDRYGRRR